jgi:predicted nucleic acid-binding protein
VVRANTAVRRYERKNFLEDFALVVPIIPVTAAMALRAGRIEGESRANGTIIPLAIC